MRKDLKDLCEIILTTLLIAFSIGIAAILVAWILENLMTVIGTVAASIITVIAIIAGVTAGSIFAFSKLVKKKKDV